MTNYKIQTKLFRRWLFLTSPHPFFEATVANMAEEEQPASQAGINAVLKVCRSTTALNDGGARELAQVSHILKDVLATSARDMVEHASGAPLLNSRSADGTPMRVVHRYRFQSAGSSKKQVERTGRSGHEFLLQNQFLRGTIDGELRTHVVMQHPVCLVHGKTAEAQFAATSAHWRSLRQFGPCRHCDRALLLGPMRHLCTRALVATVACAPSSACGCARGGICRSSLTHRNLPGHTLCAPRCAERLPLEPGWTVGGQRFDARHLCRH